MTSLQREPLILRLAPSVLQFTGFEHRRGEFKKRACYWLDLPALVFYIMASLWSAARAAIQGA